MLPLNWRNADWQILMSEDGTKSRRAIGPSLKPPFPESFDLKVTNWCNAGCSFCHEDSTTKGAHGLLQPLLDMLSPLPTGVEIAIGGGDPMSWPSLEAFLREVKGRFVPNITINELHFDRNYDRLLKYQRENLVYGIGVSMATVGDCVSRGALQHVIQHEILGRRSAYDWKNLISSIKKGEWNNTLFLGYKDFGRGVRYRARNRIETDIARLWMPAVIQAATKAGITVSFDNLAVQQLDLKNMLGPELFARTYNGADGVFTMFVDAVEQKFARSSTMPKDQRKSWAEVSLSEYFQSLTE